MRLHDLEINPSSNLLEIDIINKKGSFAIVVCDGKARLTELLSSWRDEDYYAPRQGKEG